jgi:hypothetical protein
VIAPVEASPAIQEILVEVYRHDPKNAELCERLVDLDEGIQSSATVTSRWSSGQSAPGAAPVDRPARHLRDRRTRSFRPLGNTVAVLYF